MEITGNHSISNRVYHLTVSIMTRLDRIDVRVKQGLVRFAKFTVALEDTLLHRDLWLLLPQDRCVLKLLQR